MCTKNFQTYKLDLEKAEEPEIKLPTITKPQREKKGGIPEKIDTCFTDYTKTFNSVDHNNLWKILKEMGVLDHLTCLLGNLYAGPEATVRTRHRATDWFKTGKRSTTRLYIITLLV